MMTSLKIALDWTPNTNHIGFYVAQELGFYTENNLNIDLITPDQDNYKLTPAKKVELGQADFALCPMESVLSYQTKEKSFNLIAVAALFQEDLSAIAVKADVGIERPKDLDGKTYASYKARYEDKIVSQMSINDGGSGDLKISYPDKLGIWETLQNGKADATWVFLNWEGYQAEAAGLKMKYFKMKDFGIPYSYSPVLATNADTLPMNKDTYANFLKATREGFFYAENHPDHAAEILSKYIPNEDRKLDLVSSISFTTAYMGTRESWGIIDLENVSRFLDWLSQHNLQKSAITAKELFTNSLLDK